MAEAEVRAAVAAAQRVVVKVGSSSLTTPGDGLDDAALAALVDALADLRAKDRQVVLVTSGAIAAGLAPLGLSKRPSDLAKQQAAAAVGQGLLVARYSAEFARHGLTVAQVLLTVDDITRKASYKNALQTVETLLALGVVPVVNENDTVATHEIRFGDNDRLAALVAELARADALVLLSDVDGVYTADPSRGDAEQIAFVADVATLDVEAGAAGSAVGSGGMATKLDAVRIAAAAGIPVVLARAAQAPEALAGGAVGTAFAPLGGHRPRRLLWLAHATVARGKLRLDQGAVEALTRGKASLLAAGITAVDGDFVAGDPVDLVSPDGAIVARGLVNFSSAELPDMLGRRTAWLAEALGQQYEREVVHRDAMVVFRPNRKKAK